MSISCGMAYAAPSIPSKAYVSTYVDTVVSGKANDADVVHIQGDETISGEKTFSGSLSMANALDENSNDNHVATTQWTNSKVESAKGSVPVGSADSDTFIKVWIAE